MNEKPSLTDLKALASIVAHRSFRKAADDMGLSPSTLSHVMRTLEAQLGVRLLNRTTRSVAATEAGHRLVARLKPVLRDLDLALAEVDAFRTRPSGTLRINAGEIAARMLVQSVIPRFLARHPEMAVDLVTEGRLIDIVADGFDAGIRLGEQVPQDMVAVRFGGEARFVAIAAPAYLAGRPSPQTPDDLKHHVYIVDLMTEAAAAGLGIAYVSERTARPSIEAGQLVTVLDDWCPRIPGLFLYYPSHRHVPLGLRAFIEVLKEVV